MSIGSRDVLHTSCEDAVLDCCRRCRLWVSCIVIIAPTLLRRGQTGPELVQLTKQHCRRTIRRPTGRHPLLGHRIPCAMPGSVEH